MGDRVSIQFKTGNELSVVLFDHWGGMERVKHAKKYACTLIKECKNTVNPLERFEPGTVMVDYLREILKNEYADKERIMSTIYLGCTEKDGDNSDNGHHIIEFPDRYL